MAGTRVAVPWQEWRRELSGASLYLPIFSAAMLALVYKYFFSPTLITV